MKVQRALADTRRNTKENNPLIHCITNPISIKNCANVVLAVGASPIMAEHPKEVEGITRRSQALLLNLGNITDARMESMQLSAKVATQNSIPMILDLVGVGVSPLRLELAEKLIAENSFSILKGNMSEIKAMLGMNSHAVGIDVGQADKVHENNLDSSIAIVKALASKTGSVVVASGKYDIITDGTECYIVKNGTAMLSNITGTGCMLTALIASYLPASSPIEAALGGCMIMGIAGELAEERIQSTSEILLGSASFEVHLIDSIYRIEDPVFERYANWERK